MVRQTQGAESGEIRMGRTARAALVVAVAATGLVATSAPAVALEVPNENWHEHTTAPQWLIVIAGGPVVCPNATDKPLLPSHGKDASPVANAGVCFSDTSVIHLRRIADHGGAASWSPVASVPDLYYRITARG